MVSAQYPNVFGDVAVLAEPTVGRGPCHSYAEPHERIFWLDNRLVSRFIHKFKRTSKTTGARAKELCLRLTVYPVEGMHPL